MKKFILVSSVLAGILVILGIIAPTDFEVERSIEIQKPKIEVFAHLMHLKNHDQWSPWNKRDPNMKKNYQGTDGEVGFVASWSGNNEVGEGEQEIKNILDGEKIETEVRFKKPMQDTNRAYFKTEAVDANKTKVTWGMTGKTPFPKNVICFLFNMQGILKKDFDSGLSSLKSLLEK